LAEAEQAEETEPLTVLEVVVLEVYYTLKIIL
jgi:hypothetical protein